MRIIGRPGANESVQPDFIWIDDVQLYPGRSQRVFNHSPDGFSWGYGGSGPAQLALAILLEATDDDELSIRLHQDFKEAHVANWPRRQPFAVDLDVAAWARQILFARKYPALFDVRNGKVSVRPGAEGEPCPCCGLPLAGSPLVET